MRIWQFKHVVSDGRKLSLLCCIFVVRHSHCTLRVRVYDSSSKKNLTLGHWFHRKHKPDCLVAHFKIQKVPPHNLDNEILVCTWLTICVQHPSNYTFNSQIWDGREYFQVSLKKHLHTESDRRLAHILGSSVQLLRRICITYHDAAAAAQDSLRS